MKLSIPINSAALTAFLTVSTSGFAQGGFRNLGFESASLTPVPPGQYGGEVSSLNAIPFWTAFYGTNQTTQV
jgi:hypothetical protein